MATERKGPGEGTEDPRVVIAPKDASRPSEGSTPSQDAIEQWVERGEPQVPPASRPEDEDAGRS